MVASTTRFSTAKTGYVHLGRGYTAEYVVRGRGLPLVLVPGLAGGIDLLQPLIDELSHRYRVYAYQLRGEEDGLFDRSYDLDQLVQDLDSLLNHLGLERPGLLGVSFGGAIALEFACRQPHRLSFLVVQGAGKSYQPGLFGDVARQVLDTLPLPADSPFVNQFFSVLIGDRRRSGDRFDFIVDRSWRTDQSIMAYRLSLLDGYDVESQVGRITAPTLVLGSDHDFLVSTTEARELARLIPSAEYHEIGRAGHLAFVTHATDVADALGDFQQSYVPV